LTEDTLKEAFDITVEMKKDDCGKAYIRYESNFRKEKQRC